MKKILFLAISLFLLIQVAFGLNISINPGESKSISFPQELQTINFSKNSDVSVRTLEAGIWKDVGSDISNYSPLKGYIVSNATGTTLDINYNYKPNINLNNYLIQKELKAGWNLVGVSQQNSIGEKIQSIFGFGYSLPFSQMIDFTDTNFSITNNGNELHSNFYTSGKSIASSKYVFENKAYGVFLNVDSIYSGVQNFTDSNGNIIAENVEEDENIVDEEEDDNSNLSDLLDNNNTRELTRILGKGPNKIFLAGTETNLISYNLLAGNLKNSVLEDIEFIIKKYDGNRDENTIADIDFSDISNIRLKLNDTEYIANPQITASGSDSVVIKFNNLDYAFSSDKTFNLSNSDSEEQQEDYEVDGEKVLVASLYANFSNTTKPDNFSVILNPENLLIKYGDDIVYNGGQINGSDIELQQSCYDIGSSGGGAGSSSVVTSSCLNIYETPKLNISNYSNYYSSKRIYGGEENIELYKFNLSSTYGKTTLKNLYFVNSFIENSGLNTDVFKSINIEVDGNKVGTGIIDNQKLFFENINFDIENNQNKEFKIVGNFKDINSNITDKIVKLKITDLVSIGENRNYTKTVSNKIINIDNNHYSLDNGLATLSDRGVEITTKGDAIFSVSSIQNDNTKFVLGGSKKVELFNFNLTPGNWDSKLQSLYFANDYNNDNGIDADINSDIIENIILQKDGINIGTGTIIFGKISFENLNLNLIRNTNINLKIISDFKEIDSASKTNKQIKFYLTDMKIDVDNWNKDILVNGEKIDNGNYEYLLNSDLGKKDISGNKITTRKSTFTIKNLPLDDLTLDDGIKTVYKGKITASGGNIELASLDFEFKGFLNGVGLDNLTKSGSTHSEDTIIVDNAGNTVMNNYELFIGGDKVDFIENTASGTLNDRLYVYPTRLQTHFVPVNISDGEIKSIELKMSFSNTKENDYFYVTKNRYINWSDLSAGDNHSNITNDWFIDSSLYTNGDNSTYTLTK